MQANDDYILLLSKQFSGEISPEKAVLLNDWLAQSPENKRLASELRQIWEQSGSFEKSFSPDLDAAFQQVQLKISAIKQRPRAKVVPLHQWLLRAAAAIALVLASVWGWREFSTPVTVKTFVQNEEKRLVNLPDGSRVWLRRDGALEHPQTFSGNERKITLQGEAYFEIAHNPAKPFRVELENGGVVEVLGTQFNVRQTEQEASVLVRSGKVRFYPAENGDSYILADGRKATFNKSNGETKEEKALSFNELSWQTGGLEFVGTPLQDVIADLEQHFKVKITLRNPTLKTCEYTSPLTIQPIEKVLESLSLTYQFRVTNPTSREYVLSGGDCQ